MGERAVSLTSIREVLSPPPPPGLGPGPTKSARNFFAQMADKERGMGGFRVGSSPPFVKGISEFFR